MVSWKPRKATEGNSLTRVMLLRVEGWSSEVLTGFGKMGVVSDADKTERVSE